MSEWAVLSRPDDSAAAFQLALHPPSEREMLADQRAAQEWAQSWRELELQAGDVEWADRSWRSIGRQRVPIRLTLRDPESVATFVGGEVAKQFRLLRHRASLAREQLSEAVQGTKERGVRDAALDAALRRYSAELLGFDEARFDTVVAAARWLAENSVEGLRPRQLPIRGVDTKWFASHRSVVSSLVFAATGRSDLGIVASDQLVRIRLLDPALAVGGLDDLAAPVDNLALLDLVPAAVVIAENLETVLAMPHLSGVVAVHGSGYAIDSVARIPWIERAPVVYWGDLDSNGIAILHRLRSWRDSVTSVLMNRETLERHRDLWVPEPKPARGSYSTLTDGEADALAALREFGDVRLEQERIPWEFAWQQVCRAVESLKLSD